MITVKDNVFRLDTVNTTYIFRSTKFGHMEHIYYGARLEESESIEVLSSKQTIPIGSSISYDPSDQLYCLDNMLLEWSDNGRGDFRQSPTELKMPDGSFISDFLYSNHNICEGSVPTETLPTSYNADQTLKVTLSDTVYPLTLTLDLYYSVFENTDIITRRAVLTNRADSPMGLRRIMSMSLDLPDENFKMLTLDGGWIKEGNLHERPVQYGILINSSTTGNSSNRHNPGFLLAERDADQDTGHVYGFNLVYSGNHFGLVEKSGSDVVRVQLGVNPHCFEWKLLPGEEFETPEAVITFSDKGFNGKTGFFQVLSTAAESEDKLVVKGLNDGRYLVKNRPQRLYIERFGGLMKHILPIELKPDGLILRMANRHYSLTDCIQEFSCSNLALSAGLPLPSQFSGTGYNDKVRMLGDFGSDLYIICRSDSL